MSVDSEYISQSRALVHKTFVLLVVKEVKDQIRYTRAIYSPPPSRVADNNE